MLAQPPPLYWVSLKYSWSVVSDLFFFQRPLSEGLISKRPFWYVLDLIKKVCPPQVPWVTTSAHLHKQVGFQVFKIISAKRPVLCSVITQLSNLTGYVAEVTIFRKQRNDRPGS